MEAERIKELLLKHPDIWQEERNGHIYCRACGWRATGETTPPSEVMCYYTCPQ